MTDRFTKLKRSEIMSSIKSKNTKPELIVRKLLHRLGFRFRLHRPDLPGKPDIVLPKYRTVIFVNGCFWHGHECSKSSKLPVSNATFWKNKINDNMLRDKALMNKLCGLGWKVVTIWECETKCPITLKKIILNQFPSHKVMVL